jgi:hypothetical protein
MLAHAGSFLERGDRARLSGVTSRENREPALSSLRAGAIRDAYIVSATRTVNTRHQFMNSLGLEGTEVADPPNSIRSLPLDRRAEPLAALALRINRLPPVQRFGVNRQFLNAFNEIPERNRTLNLTALANVAAYSADTLVNSGTAALQGANPAHTVLFYNIQDDQGIINIEQASADSRAQESAGQRVRRGENVGTVARELGFTTEAGISSLEIAAAMSNAQRSAGQKVRNGENVNAVAIASGFTTQAGISRLESTAAMSNAQGSAAQKVRNGEHVGNVATQLGFTTQAGISSLERVAASSREPQSAGLRVASGENVIAVAETSGITTESGIYNLESAAAQSDHDSGARRAMINGATIDEVAKRFGFTIPSILQTLQRFHDTYVAKQNQAAAGKGGA